MRMSLCAALAALSCVAAGCRSLPGPEEVSPEGLVRVASRASGGVYRAPDATYTQYRRLILEAPGIAFVAGWQDKHPDVSNSEVARIRTEAAQLYRDEVQRELVERGPYELAEEPAADVLLVSMSIEDLDIAAPGAGVQPGVRTYTTGPVKMKLTGELRDAPTGRLVGRVIMFEPGDRYPFNQMRVANRVTNAHEERLVFGKWARLLHEALAVAKAGRTED